MTFQGQIGCFDANSGRPEWEKAFSSDSGLAQDNCGRGGDDWSVVTAFSVIDGTPLWKNDKLKNRDLSVPYLLGRAAVFGDYQGYVHFLSRDTARSLAARRPTAAQLRAAPVLAGETLVVQTHDGGLYGYPSALMRGSMP